MKCVGCQTGVVFADRYQIVSIDGVPIKGWVDPESPAAPLLVVEWPYCGDCFYERMARSRSLVV